MSLWAAHIPHRRTDWRDVGHLIRDIYAEEQETKRIGVELPEGCFGWFPYPISQFVTYLVDALTAAEGPRFLDVGCGPGTKLILAQGLFQLDAAGLEIVPEFVEAARHRYLKVAETDARTWDGYAGADIVFVNRPCSDQEQLERHIMDSMKPNGVLISVNGRLTPSREGWLTVAEEYGAEPACGVWAKPE